MRGPQVGLFMNVVNRIKAWWLSATTGCLAFPCKSKKWLRDTVWSSTIEPCCASSDSYGWIVCTTLTSVRHAVVQIKITWLKPCSTVSKAKGGQKFLTHKCLTDKKYSELLMHCTMAECGCWCGINIFHYITLQYHWGCNSTVTVGAILL